jgi:hypothetical protein
MNTYLDFYKLPAVKNISYRINSFILNLRDVNQTFDFATETFQLN